MVKVALIGFGGIARIHYNAYKKLAQEGFPITVAAVCEKNTESVRNKITINLGEPTEALDESTPVYADVDTLIENEDFDAADICLPTFLHKEVAVKLLLAGKHVLCEKPMALTSEDCIEMLNAAESSGKRLMIGQCLRFDPFYRFLKDCVDTNRFGKLQYMTMHRMSEYPKWSPAFSNFSITGGCTLDTHIHDIDAARYVLGQPYEVCATEFVKLPHCQAVHSRLNYDGCTVHAECCWDEARTTPFESGYRAIFEDAAVICNRKGVKIYRNGDEPHSARLRRKDRIVEEIREFASLVQNPEAKSIHNPPKEAFLSVKLIETIRESAANGGKIIKVSDTN